ncbi:conjugal transfer protein TraD [Mesorhizobium carmichaelinearum]|uniref:conjugal transfer protein TraD n=1 Tax=Mesorhizobium carmichaelinearum TaxID=1208188 RepID=UPI000BA41891|nr:conjugal transfer protein TraD [Mesorhizobium carmichaelinearum]
MRTWQVERRQRTRHLIELGGLVVKAGIVDLTADDRATIYGALLWIAEKLRSHEGEHARNLWTAKGTQVFDGERREEQMAGEHSDGRRTGLRIPSAQDAGQIGRNQREQDRALHQDEGPRAHNAQG